MVSRLVLGCGTVGLRIVERLGDRDDVLVIADDSDVVGRLRDESVRARQDDPRERSVLEAIDDPRFVLVAGDRTDHNRTTLETAREAFPEATIVAYLGGNPDSDDGQRIESLADRTVDPTRELVDHALERTTSPASETALALRRRLAVIDGRLAVVMHDNPDPDAIASAVALCDLAEAVSLEADACYFGEISHQENRAMVNLLELELRNLEPDDSLEEYAAFALVDHSRPGINDGLPPGLDVEIVIDHHPPRGPVPATFCDLRDDVGATSTLLTEYVKQFGIEVDRRTATALLYGIRIDTNDFTRETTASDFEAAATLLPHADVDVLRQVEAPTVGGETFDAIARAIKNRTRRGSIVTASARRIPSRDVLPQAADRLLAMDGVDTTLVFGFRDEMVYVSARSRAGDVDLGETLRDAFDRIGSAGGHSDMAGAQLEVGILGEVDDEAQVDSIKDVVEEVITDRFFEAVDSQPGTPIGAYRQTSEWLFEHDGDEDESDVET
ncbi:DHH family phosphoesterase [Natrialbaceae archaeon AArc-T1-2]|uniref:DHH family phosphoesterase n=1 Tax=Natrialbaceae archaeon AArc-T1-2 TaxID=3053904 RepID=UPI00255AE493|nr:DHH family phosphoesterase [Natrialbaceae archaeon AArc-T1-2]WIV66160.1 DHH family phosphoesterase [Natrialbaceae archaeon AArc-T1-2]